MRMRAKPFKTLAKLTKSWLGDTEKRYKTLTSSANALFYDTENIQNTYESNEIWL